MTFGREKKKSAKWKGFAIEGTNRAAKIVMLCPPYHSRDARDTLFEIMNKDPATRKEYPDGIRKVEK